MTDDALAGALERQDAATAAMLNGDPRSSILVARDGTCVGYGATIHRDWRHRRSQATDPLEPRRSV
jgi:hypothetical protein